MGEAPIAVSGATGRIGGRVARHLADAGLATRLLVRDPTRAPRLANADVAVASYADGAAATRALKGVRTFFMTSAAESADRVEEHRTVIRAAVEAGVDHIVYLSFVGASTTSGFLLGRDHAATETLVREHGLSWTFVRDNFYAEEFVRFADSDGTIRGPAGSGRVAPIGLDDVGAVVATILTEPDRHRDRLYELTGSEAVTLDELTSIMSAATGRPYAFEDETITQARRSRASYGAPDWLVDAWISTYTAIADGELAAVSDDVARLLGRPPMALREIFARTAPWSHES